MVTKSENTMIDISDFVDITYRCDENRMDFEKRKNAKEKYCLGFYFE